ncbi:Uncharacterised protein [Escherichia coli]|nr:Uncharacterised protein [Escherichia coli]
MPHRALPLRGRSAVLCIEPVPVSPRLRGQRPLTPPAFGLRAPLGRPHPAPDSPGRKRPPRPSGCQRPSGVGILCQCAIVLSVDCAAQWGAGRDGAVSPVTGRAAPTAHPVGDVRQLRGGGLGYGLAGRGVGLLLRSVPQFPAICGRCPVESGAVAFHALTGIKTGK